jgi:ketosteroid isomerase-like protein
MLALLHTARVHVDTFARLAHSIDTSVPLRHEVRADLLAAAIAEGADSTVVQVATATAIRDLATAGAKVIVCTCSTIGGIAELAPVPDGVRVMRIDRPMAEQAVMSGRRIIVVAALPSTLEPTTALLRGIAAERQHSIDIIEVVCERAWPFFEAGDHSAYQREIAATVEGVAGPRDLVLLAQASMAPAAELLSHLGVPVLSSPKLGLEAAIVMYREMTTRAPNLYARSMSRTDAAVLEQVMVGVPDPEIVTLEADLRSAQLTADVDALDRLIAEDLLFTGPDGQLGTKAQDLAAHQSGVVRIREHQPTELRVRRIGSDVAIVALRTRLLVEVNGATVRGTYRYTRVWAREQGVWRVAGGHVAAVPSDDPSAS